MRVVGAPVAGDVKPIVRAALADASREARKLLEFDFDRDAERLQAAGYASKYIPMFALPTPDGAASGRQTEGAIKGEGGVAFIVPRVLALLAE